MSWSRAFCSTMIFATFDVVKVAKVKVAQHLRCYRNEDCRRGQVEVHAWDHSNAAAGLDRRHAHILSRSLCRSGASVATHAAGRAPMRGLARLSAEVV
jgi:hypothetical protein